jgi:tetratricopeptide (TPR) repeat protein
MIKQRQQASGPDLTSWLGLTGSKRLFNIFAAAMFFAVIFYGCPPAQRHISVQKISPAIRAAQPDNAYYHFLMAQLEREAGRLEEAAGHIQKAVDLDPSSNYLNKELADLWLSQKKTEDALAILKEVLRRDPDDVDALSMTGQAELTLEHPDAAITLFEKAIAKDVLREDIYHTLGNIYIQKKDYKNAQRIYQQLVKQQPGSFVGYFFLGKIYTDLNQPEAATKAFQKTLTLAPDLEEPRFRLIELYESQGQIEKSEALYQEILSQNPKSIRAAMGIGLSHYHHGQKPGAKTQFEDLGRLSLADQNVIPALVRHYIDTKKYDDAVILTEGMLKGAPKSATLHYLAGLAYDEIDNKTMVLDHFRQVPPGTKFYQTAALQVGFILHDQGKTEAAISQVKTLIEQKPDNPQPYLYLGIFYEDLKQYDAARDSVEKGLKVDPENESLLFRLGVLLDKSGSKDACIETMREVIRLNPDHANALNYLGYTYADLGRNLTEAEDLIKAAIKIKPEDGYITDSLGWVYYKSGRYAEALEVLLKAVSLVPDDPTILEHIGDAYLKNEGREKALEYYRQSLKVKKNDTMAIEKKIRDLTEE